MITNFIRTIKIKQLNGEFDNIPEDEKYLISLFDGLVQTRKGQFIQLKNRNEQIRFEYGINSNMFWYSQHPLKQIMDKFGYSQKNVEFLITRFLQFRLKLDKVVVIAPFSY